MLAYDYADRRALLDDPVEGELPPHLYALCSPCAEKLRPPLGWTLEDRRSAPPLFMDDPGGALEAPHVDRPEIEVEPLLTRQLFFGSSG